MDGLLKLIPQEETAPEYLAGVDEAGRGCLAGPVVAAAVILPAEYDLPGLDDSKKLTEKKREALYQPVREQALAWAVGVVWPPVIDEINILQSTFRAMNHAVAHLKRQPKMVLVDGNKTIPQLKLSQQAIIGGDGKIAAISAASVIAKTYRDHLMVALDKRYPQYGFSIHKGYGTKIHLEALEEHGPSRMHRLTFAKVKPEEPKKKSGAQACLPF
ncbi:MAG: ribonuclease HII [Desulfovibrio sp.]